MGGVTGDIAAVKEPAEEENQAGLNAVRNLRWGVSGWMVEWNLAYEDDGPWDTVTGLVLVSPPLGRDHLADGVCDEPHGVLSELLGMSRSGGSDP